MFSTGCKAGSLYDDAAFGTPNGLALNYVNGFAFADFTFGGRYFPTAGRPSVADKASIIDPNADPYGGLMQSRDLREIASVRDPLYRATSDILALNLDRSAEHTSELQSL